MIIGIVDFTSTALGGFPIWLFDICTLLSCGKCCLYLPTAYSDFFFFLQRWPTSYGLLIFTNSIHWIFLLVNCKGHYGQFDLFELSNLFCILLTQSGKPFLRFTYARRRKP
ncbi:hypothetical protein L1887_19876 [Cichorium endivia]|nr:hypothetical protein L1887_19876 [Cichorium endivia]